MARDIFTAHFALFFFEKPHFFFFSARIFTAGVLCISIVLFYRFIRKAGVPPSLALCATACFAFNPAIIENHHYALTDSIGLLCTIAALLCFFTIHDTGTKKSVLFGLFAGLAVSAKYNNICLLGMYMVYCLITEGRLREKLLRMAAAGAATAVVFTILNPYILINFSQAFWEIRRQSQVLRVTEPFTALSFYTGPLLLLGTTFNPLLLAVMVFSLCAALLRPRHKKIFCLAVCVCIGFLLCARHNRYGYIRYFFPLFPALFFLMTAWIEEYTRNRVSLRVCAIAFVLASGGYSAAQSIQHDLELLKPNPTASAHAWITANIEPGAKILTNVRRLQIPETPENLEKRLRLAERHKTYKQTYYRYQYEAALRSKMPRYNVRYFYDKQTYAPNTVKLDEFYATEEALDKSEIVARAALLHEFDYIIVTPDGMEGVDLNGLATPAATFGNITIYKLFK